MRAQPSGLKVVLADGELFPVTAAICGELMGLVRRSPTGRFTRTMRLAVA